MKGGRGKDVGCGRENGRVSGTSLNRWNASDGKRQRNEKLRDVTRVLIGDGNVCLLGLR